MRIRPDPQSAAELTGTAPAELRRRYHAGTLPPVLQRGLAEFLAEYGQRAVAEIDLGMPRWSDDPTHILGVLANYLRLADRGWPPTPSSPRGRRGRGGDRRSSSAGPAPRPGPRARWSGSACAAPGS